MKSITPACWCCLALLTFQVAGQPAKNEFPIIIEDVKCTVKAYQSTVCFLADDFWHEVLPANKPRMSTTAWFLQR